jgi:hypothetical protein
MEAKLKETGIGFHELRVLGSTILIKAISRDTADRWVRVLNAIGCVRVNLVPTQWNAVLNKETVLRPTQVNGFLIGGCV